jgi:hypothetical protein
MALLLSHSSVNYNKQCEKLLLLNNKKEQMKVTGGEVVM